MNYTDDALRALQADYRRGLLEEIAPFWVRHGWDREHGGILTALNEDGSLIDSDKAVWFQGRAAWTFATLSQLYGPREDWLGLAGSCLGFLREHCRAVDGKLYFTVTREGAPLRMRRRYAFSESFACVGAAAYAKATGDETAAAEAKAYFERYLAVVQTGGGAEPKVDPATRPAKGLATQMILLAMAQELRANLGDITVAGATCTAWIDQVITEVETVYLKPEWKALLEVVSVDGSVLDHFDGRMLVPGHAIECAWFILHEARVRGGDARLLKLGLTILDWMWERGWDQDWGGLLYFTDLKGLPVQEYWAEMKFWWPQNEAEIATLLAWHLSGDDKYAQWHQQVRSWSRRVFVDTKGGGDWFGYAHRDGRISTRLKGNMWKGPFHIPRMYAYCEQLLAERLG